MLLSVPQALQESCGTGGQAHCSQSSGWHIGLQGIGHNKN